MFFLYECNWLIFFFETDNKYRSDQSMMETIRIKLLIRQYELNISSIKDHDIGNIHLVHKLMNKCSISKRILIWKDPHEDLLMILSKQWQHSKFTNEFYNGLTQTHVEKGHMWSSLTSIERKNLKAKNKKLSKADFWERFREGPMYRAYTLSKLMDYS
jgi:hypothetical protein